MALRYEWGWDVARIGALTVLLTDSSGGPYTVSLSSGRYAHTDLSSVMGGFYAPFATVLKSALEIDSGLTYTVTWNGPTGYTISTSGNFTLDFTSTAAQLRLAAILGFVGDQTGAASYSSTVRPMYMIIPAMQGRSLMTDEYEPEGIAQEASADDGTAYQLAKSTSEIMSDWTQMAETDQAPSAFSAPGTYVYERQATSAIPWTYQHAFAHSRDGMQPFLTVDGSENAVHELRAEGASFHPQRFAGNDLQFWNVQFRTRLLGRI